MPACEGTDKEQPALCHTHAQDPLSKQSLDKLRQPDLQPFVSTGLVHIVEATDDVALPYSSHPPSAHLVRSTAPPITIRNCYRTFEYAAVSNDVTKIGVASS